MLIKHGEEIYQKSRKKHFGKITGIVPYNLSMNQNTERKSPKNIFKKIHQISHFVNFSPKFGKKSYAYPTVIAGI